MLFYGLTNDCTNWTHLQIHDLEVFFPFLLPLVLLEGCDFPSSTGSRPDSPAWHDINEYLPGSHLDPGYMAWKEESNEYILVTPQRTWPSQAVSRPLYVIQSNTVWPCVALGYDTTYGGIGLSVLPLGWNDLLPSGVIFWEEEENLVAQPPISSGYDGEALYDAIQPVVDEWGDNLLIENRLELFQLGGPPSSHLFWLSEIPDTIRSDYTDDAPLFRGGIFGFNGEDAWLEKTFSMPNGFRTEEADVADLYGDGIADLISIPLNGNGAPVCSFLYTPDGEWEWVGKDFP